MGIGRPPCSSSWASTRLLTTPTRCGVRGVQESDSFAISAGHLRGQRARDHRGHLPGGTRWGRRPLLLVGSAAWRDPCCDVLRLRHRRQGDGVDASLPRSSARGGPGGPRRPTSSWCSSALRGPLMWALLGEMFPTTSARAALAVAGAVQWLANWPRPSPSPPCPTTRWPDVRDLRVFAAVSRRSPSRWCARPTTWSSRMHD
ncbi:hypothetical protein QJS66_14585 [Kocuria rhizophila]|nr:hypothetical protein QJS66_14585 [Kocuria rhizophila]